MDYGPSAGPFKRFNDDFRCETGDRIEIKLSFYNHFAICVVGGKGDEISIIHVQSDRNVGSSFISSSITKAVIKEEGLASVGRNVELRVNNYLEKAYPYPSPNEIVRRARQRLGEKATCCWEFQSYNDDFSCEVGDRIEMKRRCYEHWVICVVGGRGDEIKIVHLSSSDNATGSCFVSCRCCFAALLGNKGVIKEEGVKSVVKTSKLRVNNNLDLQHRPYAPAKIVKEARSRVGGEVPYKLLTENCESFVNDMRYGVPVSEQGQRFIRKSKRFVSKSLKPFAISKKFLRSKRQSHKSGGERMCKYSLRSNARISVGTFK